eukprot:6203441-Pleurochrysis_carterae.AAC.3
MWQQSAANPCLPGIPKRLAWSTLVRYQARGHRSQQPQLHGPATAARRYSSGDPSVLKKISTAASNAACKVRASFKSTHRLRGPALHASSRRLRCWRCCRWRYPPLIPLKHCLTEREVRKPNTINEATASTRSKRTCAGLGAVAAAPASLALLIAATALEAAPAAARTPCADPVRRSLRAGNGPAAELRRDGTAGQKAVHQAKAAHLGARQAGLGARSFVQKADVVRSESDQPHRAS